MTTLEQWLFKNLTLAVEKFQWDGDKSWHGCTDMYCQECDQNRSKQLHRFVGALPTIRDILADAGMHDRPGPSLSRTKLIARIKAEAEAEAEAEAAEYDREVAAESAAEDPERAVRFSSSFPWNT